MAGPAGYEALLRDARGLRREQQEAKAAWLSRLAVERKTESLFELEVLLKGLSCFANPRNHPGSMRRNAMVAQDYHAALTLCRDAMTRVIALSRSLLGDRDRNFVFQRYLETMLPDDGARARLVRGTSTQDTPEESLFVLRHAFGNLQEVTGGLLRLPKIPFRLFFATLGSVEREVARSSFFNPLSALEFRPEFDRIENPRVLELIRQVPGDHGRRLVGLSFLSLFRMLRYLQLIEEEVRGTRRSPAMLYLTLAVLRSEARALSDHLSKRAGEQLALGFERELLDVRVEDMSHRFDQLRAEAHKLIDIKATLGGLAANLRLELRRAFEHDLPPINPPAEPERLNRELLHVIGTVRPAVQNAVLVLGKALGARLDEHGVFDDDAAKRTLSERLRRDVWMFSQIVRAFGHKAVALRNRPEHSDEWGGRSSLAFVHEFLSYFQAMGYPLLRAADYPRVDPFIAAMGELKGADLVDPDRLGRAIDEAGSFFTVLSELFNRIGEREELRGVPFDRRAAAEALKLYLGD